MPVSARYKICPVRNDTGQTPGNYNDGRNDLQHNNKPDHLIDIKVFGSKNKHKSCQKRYAVDSIGNYGDTGNKSHIFYDLFSGESRVQYGIDSYHGI